MDLILNVSIIVTLPFYFAENFEMRIPRWCVWKEMLTSINGGMNACVHGYSTHGYKGPHFEDIILQISHAKVHVLFPIKNYL